MPRLRPVALAAGLGLLLLAAGIGRLELSGSHAHAGRFLLHLRQLSHAARLEATGDGGAIGAFAERGKRGGEAGIAAPAQAAYDNMAFPRKSIAYAQVEADHTAFQRIPGAGYGLDRAQLSGRGPARFKPPAWQELGPVNPTVPASSALTNRATSVSGRVTALAVAPTCVAGNCVVYVGAAGGGVWKSRNGLAATPTWTNTWKRPKSNAIGSIALDPSHPSTIYVGTGEPSGSSDSEAGVGLYKSTNGGATWSIVKSSVPIAKNRAIGTIAIDPSNSSHILIGTDVARHGDSSVNGGRFTPPHAPPLAVYETTNGGGTWKRVLELPQDRVDPADPTGGDFFSGGITKILFDPNSAGTVYASTFTDGIWRRIGGVGTAAFQQIFHAQDPTDGFERTEFALAKMPGGKTRIYAGSGDASDHDPGMLWRVDDASRPAAQLLASENHPTGLATSWSLLSAGTYDTKSGNRFPVPGEEAAFTSYDFCQAQCSYDIGVWTPPGQPDTVVLQGSMQYNDVFGLGPPYSNGAAVVRSTNAGVSFSDMTVDTATPHPNGLHPDQRALIFDPANAAIFWVGSDGGVVRVGPSYVNGSGGCNGRRLDASGLKACAYFSSAIPTQLDAINIGLATLQFQSVTIDQKNPNDLIGGTQDNGTWAFNCSRHLPCRTFESMGGDGGQSAIDATAPATRTHSYYYPQFDTNFHRSDPTAWDWISDPLVARLLKGEQFSFYPPLIQDPRRHGYEYTAGQHVYRTTDDGGSRSYLDSNCNEFHGTFMLGTTCGDWVAISGDLTCTHSASKPSCPYKDGKGTGYVVALERASGDNRTMWLGTRRGRIFVTTNAQAGANSVRYTQIDRPAQPRRFPSGISIDPSNPDHAFISFSGYNAYTPGTPGHVFSVTYHPSSKTATWKNLSGNLGDQPITDIQYVPALKALFVSTDFGVLERTLSGKKWTQAAAGLPMGAVYGLSYAPGQKWLFAATHGRGVWRIKITPPRRLRVVKEGNGRITSRPAGIKCGRRCSARYNDGTRVTLRAKPHSGWTFARWSGACHGKRTTCRVTMKANRKVNATFTR